MRPRAKHSFARSLVAVVFGFGILVFGGLIGYIAARESISTAPDEPVAALPAVVEATSGTLIDQRPVQVRAGWASIEQSTYRRDGTITATMLPGGRRSEVVAGAVLYRIDQLPVIAMPGGIPAYRDLGVGIKGEDVAQLQAFLGSQGVDLAADGNWGSATTRAWTAWQRDQLLVARPDAALGTIVFFSEFPVTIAAVPAHVVGAVVGDADVVFDRLEPLPEFVVPLTAGSTMPPEVGAQVAFSIAGVDFDLTATGVRTVTEDGTIEFELHSSAQTACAAWCDDIDTNDPTVLSATMTVAGPADGTVIPLGLIRTSGSSLFVVDGSGQELPVEIVLQVGGNAVVDGVEAGTLIEVPGVVPG